MSRLTDLRALARLTDTAFAARQSAMGQLRRHEQALRDKLAALESDRSVRATSLTGVAPDVALAAGADLRWHAWIEGRRAALNAELSRNRVAQEAARAALARAFGRAQATGVLVGRAVTDRATAQTRRDDASS